MSSVVHSLIGIFLFAQEKNKSDLHTVQDLEGMVYISHPCPMLFYLFSSNLIRGLGCLLPVFKIFQ